jgi:hypothetical protein
MSLASDLRRSLDPTVIAEDVGFDLDDWQREILESDHKRLLICASRQCGKSTVVSLLAVREAQAGPGDILCCAPSQRQSSELFRKIRSTLVHLKTEFSMDSATKVELPNAARIICLPGSEATVRGYSAPRMILVDEASRVPDDFYAAIRPMLAAGDGRLVVLSTPWGRRGWFFNAAEFGGETWQRYRVPASECPRISADFLEEELRELGPLRFASEYECQFVDAAESLFPTGLIEAALSHDVEPLWITT